MSFDFEFVVDKFFSFNLDVICFKVIFFGFGNGIFLFSMFWYRILYEVNMNKIFLVIYVYINYL